MTSPKITTFHRGGARFYVHPGDPDKKVPGVTSVLNMVPKPFLKPWAAKMVAEAAVEGIDELVTLAKRDPDGAVDYLKRAPDRNTKRAADAGTAAHGVFESLSLGQPIGPVTEPIMVFARQYADLLDKIQPEILRTEDTVWNDTHAYAGSFDAFGRIQGEKCWIDNKTTRSGVHAEVALQLAAYKNAEFLLDGETGEEELMPHGDRGVVFHVRPEGWAVYEVPVTDDVFDYFLALRKVFVWDSQIQRNLIGRPAAKGAAVIAEGAA
jgi:hypothetical protein